MLDPGACSAWAMRSLATKAGGALSSATTTISLGPAMQSMATWPDAGRLGRADGHQQGGRVSGGPARHDDADAAQRAVAEAKAVAAGDLQLGVAVQKAELERQDVLSHAPHRVEEAGVSGGVGKVHLGRTDAQRVGREADAVEVFGVLEDGGETASADVVADALDDLLRRERSTEDLAGQLATALRDDVALGAEFVAEAGELFSGAGLAEVNASQGQGRHWRSSRSVPREAGPCTACPNGDQDVFRRVQGRASLRRERAGGARPSYTIRAVRTIAKEMAQ